jgi:K+ transporter
MKKSNPQRHLIKGAEQLVANYKTPAEFLIFISDALQWVHDYEVDNPKHETNKDPHFNLLVIIEEIITPWINSTEENKIETIASGIEKLHDMFGYEGHHESIGRIMATYAKYMTNFGSFDPEIMDNSMHGINTLTKIGYSLYEYEKEINEASREEKKEAITTAE